MRQYLGVFVFIIVAFAIADVLHFLARGGSFAVTGCGTSCGVSVVSEGGAP